MYAVNNDIQEEYLMLKSTNNVEKNVYELEITIDGEKFEAAIQKAYLKQRKDITIKGFRKGKAPRAFIEKIIKPME